MTVPTYTQLNKLLAKYGETNSKSRCKFHIVGFPCNQFAHQEPGNNNEILNILKYVRPGNGYEPHFPLTSKVEVNGAGEEKLFTWLKGKCPRPNPIISTSSNVLWSPIRTTDIQWNFEKFLVNHKGVPVKRYSSDNLDLEVDIAGQINLCLGGQGDYIDDKEEASEKIADEEEEKWSFWSWIQQYA